MYAGKLIANTDIDSFTGTISSKDFDIQFKLEAVTKTSARAPAFEAYAQNRVGRWIRIGAAWDQNSKAGNRFISLQLDVGQGPFRVNAVQSDEARGSDTFEIIPFVGRDVIKAGSLSGELTAMDADDAYTGYVANMSLDLAFTLIPNGFKTEEKHPDYHIEMRSPRNVPIRIGAAWKASGATSGNSYISLLVNTPDGDLRVNAVQNEAQRGGDTYSIIPFVDASGAGQSAGADLSLVA